VIVVVAAFVCVCSVWVLLGPCVSGVGPKALPFGGLPPFGVPPPVLTDSSRARRAALRTAHAQRLGILASIRLTKCCQYRRGHLDALADELNEYEWDLMLKSRAERRRT